MKRKVALITGASRGIGRKCALLFAKYGYDVAINSRSVIDLEETSRDIQALGVDCLALPGDVGDHAQVRDIFARLKKRFGTIDVLVNNAGTAHIGLLHEMTIEEWHRIIETNLTSVFNCCHQAIPLMLSGHSGKIVNVSSIWGNVGASCEVAYSASKGGINAFTKALARELAPSHIQVNAIACGLIDTTMNAGFDSDDMLALIDEIPASRIGRPEEAAQLIYDLCAGHDYLTGQIITLDGGWT